MTETNQFILKAIVLVLCWGYIIWAVVFARQCSEPSLYEEWRSKRKRRHEHSSS